MKKIISFLLLIYIIFYISNSYAIDWVKDNQSTIQWDVVDPIDPTDITEYIVYLVNSLTDHNKENPIEVGKTANTEYTLNIIEDGKYIAGVQTVIKLSDGTYAGHSGISWSDDEMDVKDGKIFGFQCYKPRNKPRGIGCLGL